MKQNGNSDALTWRNERRKLRDLVPQRDNPRQIRKEQAERLVESWDKFNQPQVISIGPGGEIYDGHQRYHVWMAAYGGDFEVDVRVSSRPLARREWQELTVLLHEGAMGEWDFDALAEWDGVSTEELLEWGFMPYKLGLEAQEIDYEELWKGMPEFEQEDAGPIRTIKVHFENESDVVDFARLIGQKITDKTKFIWHPEKQPMNLIEYTCEDES